MTGFGSSEDARRTEDGPLLTGQGHFTDDIDLPGQTHAVFVRSPIGHGEIRRIDYEAAKKLPGVLAVLTAQDLAEDGVGGMPPLVILPGIDGKPMFGPAIPVLALERVRYVGEPLAIVVAETAAQAQDSADAVVLELTDLPAASNVRDALAEGAPVLWPEAPDNVSLDWHDGDADAVEAAFQSAAHIARARLHNTRLAPSAIEPRAAIGQWDESSGRYTLTACTQGTLCAVGMWPVRWAVSTKPGGAMILPLYSSGERTSMSVVPASIAASTSSRVARRLRSGPLAW